MSTLIAQQPPATCLRLETSDEDLLALDRDDLIRMLILLYLVREFETKLLDLKDQELVHGPVHTSIGQEAVAAAVSLGLRKTDLVASSHRAHGHFLSKAFLHYAPDNYQPLRDDVTPDMQMAVDRTLAEIMGLKAGWCGGRGGSMHLCDPVSGNIGSNAIVGGGIAIAAGAAWAQRLQNRDSVVVSYLGDGAVNQGCFHEVANMAALWDAPVLFLVENNLYAVGTGTSQSSYVQDLALRTLGVGFDSLIVDGMDPVSMYVATREATRRLRERPFPFLVEAKTYRHYHHAGRMVGSAFGYRPKDEEAEWMRKDPIVTYPERLIRQGLLTGAEDERLRGLAKDLVAHAADLVTEQRQGALTIPAARWPAPDTVWQHLRSEDSGSAGAACREQSDFTDLKPMTYAQAIARVTLRSMQRDDRVIVLGEEVANLRGGAYGATRGIKEAFPDRLINTPISETGFVGMGGGLAVGGLKPVVEIMFPDFALMASDQMFNQIGKLRHMYGGQVSFPLIVRTRVAAGYGYGGQHSMHPSGLFAMFPGWRVVAPSNPFDYIGLFNTAMRLNDPVLIVEHGFLYADQGPVPVDAAGAHLLDYEVAYGKAKVVREGADVTVLTYLLSLPQCLRAAEALANEGLSAEVIDLRTLDYLGMDWATIGESVRKTGSVIVVEEGARSLGLSARLSDEISERWFDYLDCPVSRVAAPDVPPPVSKRLEEAVLPSADRILAGMRQAARHDAAE